MGAIQSQTPTWDIFSELNPILISYLNQKYQPFVESTNYSNLLELLKSTPTSMDNVMDSYIGTQLFREYITHTSSQNTQLFSFVADLRSFYSSDGNISTMNKYVNNLYNNYFDNPPPASIFAQYKSAIREDIDSANNIKSIEKFKSEAEEIFHFPSTKANEVIQVK